MLQQIRDGRETGLQGHDRLLRELMEGLVEGAIAKHKGGAENENDTDGLRTFKKGAAVLKERQQHVELRRSMFQRFSKIRAPGKNGNVFDDEDGDDDNDEYLDGENGFVSRVQSTATAVPLQPPSVAPSAEKSSMNGVDSVSASRSSKFSAVNPMIQMVKKLDVRFRDEEDSDDEAI
jgi:hypothetical protein